MRCEHELRKLLESWVNTGDKDLDRGAVDVGVEMFRIFYVVHQIWIRDEIDRDFANDITRAILDLTLALPKNPFWRVHSSTLLPLLHHTVVNWTAAAKYLDRGMNPSPGADPEKVANDRIMALHLQNTFVDLITAVLSLAVPDYFDCDVEIRDRLMDFKERHLFAQ